MLARGVVSVVWASALCLLGCSGSGGSTDAGNPGVGGTGGSGTGTGGSSTGGASSADRTPFLATWTATVTLAVSAPCPDVSSVTDIEQVTVSAGTASDLVRGPSREIACAIPLDVVSATQATLAMPIQCAVSSGTYNFSSWTFTISGNSGTESASGTVTLTGVGVTCPVSVSTTLSR